VVGALWSYDCIRRLPALESNAAFEAMRDRMKIIVIAVDPSGCSGPEDERSDEIGIVVCGLGYDGCGYVLEDLSGHYSPEQWGRVVVGAYQKWEADRVVAEQNYGGDMVRATVYAIQRNVAYKKVSASRGKHVRADPVSALYHKKLIYHVGNLVDLETQLMGFDQSGYKGERSPDRADAMVWGITDLMIDHVRGDYAVRSIGGTY
jgi:phage terminase large subunit-like protein